MLDEIKHLVDAGFAIHWLHPREKRPIGNDWSEKPVASFEKLKKTYSTSNNVGVRLGMWSKVGGAYLHVIDLDIRDNELVDEAKSAFHELFPKWKEFPVVVSGSGGESRHYYLLSYKPFPSKKLAHSETKWIDPAGKSHWSWEIELFGTGKQVAIPPSIHPDTGKPYTWQKTFDFDDLDFGFGPFVSSDYLNKLVLQEDENDPLDPDSDERTKPLGLTIDEARDILSDLPEVQYCDDRDGWLQCGMALHHEFSGSDEAYKLWCDHARQSDKFDKTDQRRVWKSFKGKSKPIRMASLVSAAREARLEAEFENLEDTNDFDDELTPAAKSENAFDDLLDISEPVKESKREKKLKKAELEAELGHVPPKIKRLNKKHAVAFVNGKTIIITENYDGSHSYGSVSDLNAWYENDRVATENATEPVSKAWMRHKKRRQYPNGIVFAPGSDPEGAYNHWRGFSVEPEGDERGCKRFLAHLRKIICNDDETLYRYALSWFAHMIQKPEEKPGVAMVLRGKKGAGKDSIAEYVGSLFPHNHIIIANQEQLVGKFNAHQEKCLLLHVEEGYWAGSKNAEGSLKYLITSEKVLIEPKGLNAFSINSYLRLFISSNEDWVVPATADERRYYVLDVPATRKGDYDYFRALREERDNGGKAALLNYLMNYDLTGFNVRDVPSTTALAEQKTQGLKNIERWWFGMLESGELEFDALPIRGGKRVDWLSDAIMIDRDEFRDAYSRWMRSRRYDGEELDLYNLGKRFNSMLPNVAETRPRSDGKRIRAYIIPNLEDCRRDFETFIGSKFSWDRIVPMPDEDAAQEGDF